MRKCLEYEEHEQKHRDRIDTGRMMFHLRVKAKVPRTELAHYLGVSDPHLFDMEVGNRTYQEKYIDDAIIYCEEAKERQRNLIKNQ
jgi:hypothetical protein